MPKYSFTITSTDETRTIDSFLIKKGFSRKFITALKREEGNIRVNGDIRHTDCVLQESDVLTVTSHEQSHEIIPADIPLDIVYEDDDILIINKQPFLSVHPSKGNLGYSLANGVINYYHEHGYDASFRCINRLDRNTSGLTIIAKNRHVAALLSEMVKHREIRRYYLAVTEGFIQGEGIIEQPIKRAGNTVKRIVAEDGEQALTMWRALCYNPENDTTLVQLQLLTGRTHQIRVHMAYIGHPVAGDDLYNPSNHLLDRQALHACQLIFTHPITKKEIDISIPLPDDMLKLI